MDILTFLGVCGFIFRFGNKATGLLFLWWRKEYRLDRMIIHLQTKQGENVLLGKTNLSLIALMALWFVFPAAQQVTYTLLVAMYTALGILYARRIRHWLIPPISPKVITVFLGLCAMVLVSLLIIPPPLLIGLTISDLLLFPVSVLVVLMAAVPTWAYHRVQIMRATRRLRAHTPMRIIGVTGSYGKTSVKDYLATILESAYPTIKTAASKNSPIGIAEEVLRSLSPSHKIFVVEMGAYKKGEIAEMTDMVRPEIGILTAINPQHQDLFGSIAGTMSAKYELLQGLVGKKIAIVNLDDERTNEMGTWAKRDGCEVWGVTTTKDGTHTGSVASGNIFRATGITADSSGVSFDCVRGKEKVHVQAHVLGEHQVGNILAAIAGAVAGGMKFGDAARAASGVKPVHRVMEIRRRTGGPTFIDDTFNNNPDAARAAIKFLSGQKGSKILVFQPMVELGSFAEKSHEEVGVVAATYCDVILLTNANFFDSFEKGVRSVSRDIPLLVLDPSRTAEYIRAHAKKGDTVLFKGKDAEHALNQLMD